MTNLNLFNYQGNYCFKKNLQVSCNSAFIAQQIIHSALLFVSLLPSNYSLFIYYTHSAHYRPMAYLAWQDRQPLLIMAQIKFCVFTIYSNDVDKNYYENRLFIMGLYLCMNFHSNNGNNINFKYNYTDNTGCIVYH